MEAVRPAAAARRRRWHLLHRASNARWCPAPCAHRRSRTAAPAGFRARPSDRHGTAPGGVPAASAPAAARPRAANHAPRVDDADAPGLGGQLRPQTLGSTVQQVAQARQRQVHARRRQGLQRGGRWWVAAAWPSRCGGSARRRRAPAVRALVPAGWARRRGSAPPLATAGPAPGANHSCSARPSPRPASSNSGCCACSKRTWQSTTRPWGRAAEGGSSACRPCSHSATRPWRSAMPRMRPCSSHGATARCHGAAADTHSPAAACAGGGQWPGAEGGVGGEGTADWGSGRPIVDARQPPGREARPNRPA